MAFTTITVTRSYKTARGRPAAGTVRFTPSNPMVNGSTVIAAAVTGTLDRAGLLVLPVAANNDPATVPTGSYYTVTEALTGQPTRTYSVVIPYTAAAGTVDLSTLTTITGPVGASGGLQVLVYSGGAYPPRPAGVVGGLVRYIGPVQPTDWVTNDEWVNNT